MEFYIYFHVKTPDLKSVLALLQQYTGIEQARKVRYADNVWDSLLPDNTTNPDYLVVNKNCPQWITVECNSFKKLYEWGEQLSTQLQTLFIQSVYRASDQYAYLLIWENGIKLREIESIQQFAMPLCNEGKLFAFEKEKNGNPIEYLIKYFDLDSIVTYCQAFGIDMVNLQCSYYSHVLRRSLRTSKAQ